jgi:hypothetical protein
MAIAFVGSNHGQQLGNAADQTLSLTALTGGSRSSVEEGDIVIAVYNIGNSVGLSTTIEDPSAAAYTTIGSQIQVSDQNDTSLHVAYKIMGSTTDATTKFKSHAGSLNHCMHHTVYVFSGVDTTTPLDVTPTSSTNQNGAGLTPAAITPVTTDAAVVAVAAGAHTSGGSAIYSTTGMTNFITYGANSLIDSCVGVGHIPSWVSGAVTPAAFTFSGGASNFFTSASITFALRPSSAVGNIKCWSGADWIGKPVKYWNGSAWVAKPLKYWNGSAWTTTPY